MTVGVEDGLAFERLGFSYPALDRFPEVTVLRDAAFAVPAGGAAAIAGAADAGKTTLARVLAGLLPRFSGGTLAGSARFADRDLLAARPCDSMERVGLVFQDPDEQLVTTRCDSEVAFALESLGVPRGEMAQAVARGLALVGLESMRSRNPGTLSGGEKKRLLIACLAAIDPGLWILDEVFQELDHAWRMALMDHIEREGRTALFLDSRWSPIYDGHCGRGGLLTGGTILPLDGDAGSRTRRLREAGLVLPGVPFAGAGNQREPVLKAQGLTFGFADQSAFRLSVEDLTLERGVITAMAGRNGSGKSTLGKLLCGLLTPDGGSILLPKSGSWRPAPARSLQQRVGYLFQNPDYQVFLPTVAEELSFGIGGAGSGRALRDQVDETIRLFRLPTGDTPPALMSYGARRRLQAATAHMLSREVLILDEIDSGLSCRDFLEILPALASPERGVVLITHDLSLARHVAGRILVMDGGRIVEDLAPERFPLLDRLLGGA